MYWKCVNDYFAYCDRTPNFDVEPKSNQLGFVNSAVCPNDPATCHKYSKKAKIEEQKEVENGN